MQTKKQPEHVPKLPENIRFAGGAPLKMLIDKEGNYEIVQSNGIIGTYILKLYLYFTSFKFRK